MIIAQTVVLPTFFWGGEGTCPLSPCPAPMSETYLSLGPWNFNSFNLSDLSWLVIENSSLLVGWQAEHPVCEKFCFNYYQNSLLATWHKAAFTWTQVWVFVSKYRLIFTRTGSLVLVERSVTCASRKLVVRKLYLCQRKCHCWFILVMLISNFLLYRISSLKIRYQSGYRFIPVFRCAVLSLITYVTDTNNVSIRAPGRLS